MRNFIVLIFLVALGHAHDEQCGSICNSDECTSSESEDGTATPEKPNFTYGLNDPYGPPRWGKISATCDGKRQSPININTKTVKKNSCYKPIVIRGISKVPSIIEASNNGHAFVIKFKYADGKPATVTGGPLKVPYIVDNFHWHWGTNNQKGSDHFINGRQYAAEGHIVSYNSNYESVAEAKKHEDGLSVFGFFYKLTNAKTDNPFIDLVKYAIEPNSPYNHTESLFTMKDITKKSRFDKVYTYKGSLTAPACEEVVTWLVADYQIPINSEDLEEFRQILDDNGNPLKKNSRPIQNLNNRKITLIKP